MTALPWDAWSNSNQQRTLRKPRQGQSDNAWSPVPFVSIKQPKLLLLQEQEGDSVSMKPAAVHLFLVYTRVHTYFYTRKHTRILLHISILMLSLLATGISAQYRDHQWWSGSRCTFVGVLLSIHAHPQATNHTTAMHSLNCNPLESSLTTHDSSALSIEQDL